MSNDSTELVRCLICTKGNVKKGMAGTFCLKQDFSKVKFIIKEQIKRESHLQKLAESKFSTAESLKVAKRSDLVGMRLGLLAYQIINHGEAFISYHRQIANLLLLTQQITAKIYY